MKVRWLDASIRLRITPTELTGLILGQEFGQTIEFPGGVWETIKGANRPFYDSIVASIPWGRLGTDAEVANVIVFAASPRASWVTGACLSIDGGQHKGNL